MAWLLSKFQALTLSLSAVAILVAGAAAVFTGLQWRSSERAVMIADQARKDSNAASQKALELSERARRDSIEQAEQQRRDSAAALAEQTKRADTANHLAQRSASAAEQSAKAADDSRKLGERVLQNSIESFQEERRPWLFVEKTEHDPNNGMIVNVTLTNHGKTPAYGTNCQLFHEYGIERLDLNSHALVFTPIKREAVVRTDDQQPLLTGDKTSCSVQMFGPFLQFYPAYSVHATATVTYLDEYQKEYRVNICYQVVGIAKPALRVCVEPDANTSR